jgi:hypothetical protein
VLGQVGCGQREKRGRERWAAAQGRERGVFSLFFFPFFLFLFLQFNSNLNLFEFGLKTQTFQ